MGVSLLDNIRIADKVILFDWGGVVDSTDFENKYCYNQLYCDAIRYAFELPMSYTDEQIWKYLNGHKYYMTSHDAPNEVVFNRMCREIFRDLHPDNMYDAIEKYKEYTLAHQNKITYWQDIIDIEYETAKWCKTGIMSDLSWLDGHRLRYQIDLDKFEYLFLSYEVGCTKRDGDLFAHVNNALGRSQLKVLLIDDMRENCKRAIQLGWANYQAKEHDVEGIQKAINTFLGI